MSIIVQWWQYNSSLKSIENYWNKEAMRLVLSVCTFHYLYFDEFWEHDIIIWLFISDDVFLLKASREFIRDDLMSFIQGNNKDGRDILIRFFYHWRWSWVWLRWWFEDQNADQWRSQESKWRRLGWVRTTKTWSLRRNKVSWEELKSWWLSSSPSSLSSLSSLFLSTRGPYWMLVNSTIFTPSAGDLTRSSPLSLLSLSLYCFPGEIIVIVTTMEEVLNMKLDKYCGSQGSSRITAEGNCKVRFV